MRKALFITALVTLFFATTTSPVYATSCCKKTTQCISGKYKVLWLGNFNNPTDSNCAGPRNSYGGDVFVCAGVSADYYDGTCTVSTSTTTPSTGGYTSCSDQCTKTGGALSGSNCYYGGSANCSGPGVTGGGGNPCPGGSCNGTYIQRCKCGNAYIASCTGTDCAANCKAAGLNCTDGNCAATEPAPTPACTTLCERKCVKRGECSKANTTDYPNFSCNSKRGINYDECRVCTKVCKPTPKIPTPTKSPTSIPPTATATPEALTCQNLKVFVGAIDMTGNVSAIRYGDTVTYIGHVSALNQSIKSLTFTLTVNGAVVETKEVPATKVNDVWAASYIRKVDSYGTYSVKVTAITPL
jgi:hypothetical protein